MLAKGKEASTVARALGRILRRRKRTLYEAGRRSMILQNLREETREEYKSRKEVQLEPGRQVAHRVPPLEATDKSCKSNLHGVEQAEASLAWV